MIKEVLVVEGKMDVVAIDKAVEADCIITEGFNLKKQALKNIEEAYKKRGIIILTDPDPAGERIRRFLSKKFPEAKHAFVPKEDVAAYKETIDSVFGRDACAVLRVRREGAVRIL